MKVSTPAEIAPVPSNNYYPDFRIKVGVMDRVTQSGGHGAVQSVLYPRTV
jgi:hypothetical protein